MSLLSTAKANNENYLQEDLRNRIQDTVRSYRHFWDPFSETLQNSVDAINRRFSVSNVSDHYLFNKWNDEYNIESEPEFTGRILIEVWPSERKIRISDNGTGIQCEKVEKILLPEGSDKVKGKDYGYKGKGLTYVAFISDSFKLKTKFFVHEDTHEIMYDGLFDWLKGKSQFPGGPIENLMQSEDAISEGYNTEITFTLNHDYATSFPSNTSLDYTFDLFDRDELIGGFEVVLRTKTAIGNTKYLFGKEPIVPITVTLKVYSADGKEYEREIPYRYFHPSEHPEFNERSYDFKDYLIRCTRVGFEKDFRCLYWKFLDQKIGTRLPLKADFHHCAISSNRLNEINDQFGFNFEGLDDAGLTYGVYLAIDGMPTGIRIDNWDQKGGVNKRFLAIADVDITISDELDAGRKGISASRARQISDLAYDLKYCTETLPDGTVSDRFTAYASQYLDWGQSDDRFEEETDFEVRVESSKEYIKENERNEPILLRKMIEISSLEHFPLTEDETRLLFHELMAKNVIKGYKVLYAAGSRAIYDAAFTYELPLIEENLCGNDPLGFSKTQELSLKKRGISVFNHKQLSKIIPLQSDAICVEFKQSIGSFVEEINQPSRTSKSSKELNLLIAWSIDIDTKYNSTYTLAKINDDRRLLHSTTHKLNIITPDSTEVYCIVLRDLLSFL